MTFRNIRFKVALWGISFVETAEPMLLRSRRRVIAIAIAAFGVASCGGGPALPPLAGFGPTPQLPPPKQQLIPVVKIAPAKGWMNGRTPTAAPGFRVAAYAQGLAHPRWLYVLPNGDVLVSETNGPGEPVRSLKGWIMSRMMRRASHRASSARSRRSGEALAR